MVHFARQWGLHAVACLAAIIFAAVVGPSFSAFNLKAFQGTTNPPPPPPPPHPCPDCDNKETSCPDSGKKNGQGSGQGQGGKHPVCYGTGENFLNLSELSSAGLSGWKHGRSFLSDTAYADGLMGPGWRATGQMQLVQKNGFVVLVSGNSSVRSFTQSGSTYTGTMFYQDTLATDAVNHTLVFTSTNGNQWTFFDFSGSWGVARRGHLKQFTDAAGDLLTTVYSTTAGPTLDKILEVDQTDTNPQLINRFVYAYNLSGVASGQLSSVTYQRSVSGVVSTVRRVDYTYYAAGGPNGPAGSLQWSKVSDGTNVLDVYYHRYNALDAQGRLPLRYVLGPTGYDRAKASLSTDAAIDAASDATIAQWASHYFEYDTSLRVTKEIVQGQGCGCGTAGGKGTFTYAYTTSTLTITDQFNNWYYKTVETLPDGNQNIVYTTPAGATMLFAFKEVSSGRQWISFIFHDSQGREYSTYTPSAVASYNEATPTLSVTTNSGGLGVGRNFYGATNLSLGQVAGYQNQTSVQAVGGVAFSTTSQTTYTSRAGASGTIYPVASATVYRNPDGTGPITTSFSYTWQGSSDRILQKTTTNPVVSTAQNGSNAATSRVVQYDAFGREAWTKDEEGYIQNVQYDSLTGAVTTRIIDVNTTTNPGPSGWVTPAGGGLNLTTTIVVDGLGRETKVTDAGSNITYKVYNDSLHQVRIYPGWNTATNLPTGPTRMIREDRPGSYRETLTMSATPAVTGGVPTGTEAVSGLQSLSRDYLDTGDRITSTSSYFNFSGLTYSTTPVIGTLGTHFYQANFNYDVKGRQDRTQTWDGTITRTVYDSLDRVSSAWVGTDDTPTTGDWSPTNTAGTNLIKTDSIEYDSNGVGNGYLTKTKHFTSATVSLDVTYQRDYRGRDINRRGPDNVAVSNAFDNLDQVTMTQTYADANANFVIDSGELRAKTVAAYDDRSQIFQNTSYNVDPSTGAVGDTLTTNYWFSPRGFAVKTRGPNGDFEKNQYDGARRRIATFASYDSAETSYADALTVTGDTVVEQLVFLYDKNGNPIETDEYRRCSASTKTGDLSVTWSATDSRRMFSASWFDPADRRTSEANYGTNGGAAFTRPTSAPAPNSSDTILVTKYGYDLGGHQSQITDNLNRLTQITFDGLGRKTQSVNNYVTGTAVETSLDTDRTLTISFDSVGRPSLYTAYNPKGTGQGVQHQVTTLVYGTTANVATPAVFRNDLLTAIIYPDSDDTYNPNGAAGGKLANGADGVYDRREYKYDYAGRRSTLKDQRGVVHTLTYDSAGRLSDDTLTTPLPAGVDASVLRLSQRYDSVSRPSTYTSYSDVAGTQIVNQVASTFDGWGNEIKNEQSHVGAVVSGSSPAYQRGFVDGATSHPGPGKYLRPSSMTFPNGRVVYINYPTSPSIGDTFSRIDNFSDDSAGTIKLAQYTFLGGSSILDISHPQVTGGLVYRQGPENSPGAWDTFDRQIMTKWRNTANTSTHIELDYTFDRASNIVTRKRTSAIAPPTPKDEAYTVDGLNRITKVNRGTLAGSPLSITDAAATFSQKWPALESTGNWRQFQIAPSGANNFTFQQTRVHNSANEIDTDNNDADAAGSSITGSGGAAWIAPTADKAGNLKSGPVVGLETTRQWFTYDGWSRLVKIQADNAGAPGADISEYQYDARGHRTVKLLPSGSNWNRTDYYYTHRWQCIEERTLANTTNKTTVATVPHFQWVYDLRYMDAVLLRDENKNGDSTCNGTGDQRLFYTQDANANTVALVNTSGAVVERYVYNPYGQATILDGNWNSQAATVYNNEIQFVGYRVDPESGLHQVRHRQYHSTLGRWMQRDPKEYHDGANLLEYVASRPLDQRDPWGLAGEFHAKVSTYVQDKDHFAWNNGRADITTFKYDAEFDCKGEGDDLHVEMRRAGVKHENDFKGVKKAWEFGPVKVGWHFEVKDDARHAVQGKCELIDIEGEVSETFSISASIELPEGGEMAPKLGGVGGEFEGENGKLTFDATFKICCCCALEWETQTDVYSYSIALTEKHYTYGKLGQSQAMYIGDNWANVKKCFEKSTKPKIWGKGSAPMSPVNEGVHELYDDRPGKK